MVGSAAFWIALVVIAIMWTRLRREQMKHETIRQIVEKTGQVDEQQLKELLTPMAPDWTHEPAPGAGYRTLRILGVLVVVGAVSLVTFAGIMFAFATRLAEEADLGPVFAIAIAIAIFGGGLFFCSRFLPKPLPEKSARDDRT
jgi:hypothetical protein